MKDYFLILLMSLISLTLIGIGGRAIIAAFKEEFKDYFSSAEDSWWTKLFI